tara:strand:+ start:3909 stop:5828 length:1920 start_codon:yes stop_codon:yes gene_type:complete
MIEIEKKAARDDLDLISILSVLFDNFNLLISIFLASFLAVLIFYLSSENLYRSDSLLEIKESTGSNFLPSSLSSGINNFSSEQNTLEAEIEIYRSKNTIEDAIKRFNETDLSKIIDHELSVGLIRSNLIVKTQAKTLLNISFVNTNKDVAKSLLDLLNDEYIQDRKNFKIESSIAGKNFIQNEIPRIKSLLKDAEDKLNNFKISTNTTDIIFDISTRNTKLDRLKNRINEIEFKELELKEFYKENHPIYLTLSQQKNLVLSQIEEIEKDLPNIPSTQRTLENLKREVDIYSNVLKDLSSQELALGMTEASSVSNVRIINYASESYKISPKILIFISSLIFTLLVFIYLSFRHFLGEKITNQDALYDYVGKDKVLGELPILKNIKDEQDKVLDSISKELLNRTVYEITHSEGKIKNICVVSSRKNVGKTEISNKIFQKLKEKYKVCLIDLDYRKKGLTQILKKDSSFKTFDEFLTKKNDYMSDNESLFIPSLDIDDPTNFFTSDKFKDFIISLNKEYDFVICDTPPWKLFVDAQIISKFFDTKLYVVCNQVSTFKDIEQFIEDNKDDEKIRFFYNKFNIFFNFLWYKYQYPYFSRNYYYDYQEYSTIKRNFTFSKFSIESLSRFTEKIKKWANSLIKKFF